MKPVDAVLAVTYSCNARCGMCGTWRATPRHEIEPAVYHKLPSTLLNVNLTGGEPFLRDDLPAVHEAVRNAAPRARTIISTNGLLTDRILSQVRAMAKSEPRIGVAVSIDGPTTVHDELRGVSGAFDRAMNTLRSLQSAGFTNLRMAFTGTRQNLSYLSEMYQLSRKLGVEFTCAIEHGSDHYFHTPMPKERLPAEELKLQLAPVIRAELRSFSPKRWARAYFMHGLDEFNRGRRRPLPCRPGCDFFFMDPSGDIYTCNAAPFRMGNLAQQDFEAIWDSPEAATARDQARGCPSGCWMICTARTAIRGAWPRVLVWAVVHRLLGFSTEERRP